MPPGVREVLVNGQLVLRAGEHTGAKPGRVVRGPGVWHAPPRRGMVQLSDEGRRVHQTGFVFDGHNDLPWEIRTRGSRSFERIDLLQPQPQLHTDIPRLRKGNVGAQFWSVYVPAETARTGQALMQTLEQIDLVNAMVERYGDVFEKARTASDVRRIQAAGKIASLIGVEGGHAIEDSLENLRRLRGLGAAYMTLTHSDTVNWADSATDEARHGGLSAFGEEVVREMNRLGMLVDLSHVSPDVMKDALRISRRAGDFLPLLCPRDRGSPPQRARRRAAATGTQRRTGDGQLLLRLRRTAGGAVAPGTIGARPPS